MSPIYEFGHNKIRERMMQNDVTWIQRFLEGDEQALSAIFQNYKAPIYRFCLKMLCNSEAAKDAVQETFLRAIEKRNQLRDIEAFRPWLFSIARNYCLSQLRHSIAHRPREHDPVVHETTSATIEMQEGWQHLQRAINNLKPAYREVLLLREYDSLSYEEIAIITHSTMSAVKSKLFKARRQLYQELKPFF